jgi:tetratricopeptide (TPR) repeat protein
MEMKKLSDDDLLDVIREARAWKERDAQRTIKYQRLIRLAEKRRKIRQMVGISTAIAAIFVVFMLIPWSGNKTKPEPDILYTQYYEPFQFAIDYRDGYNDSIGPYKQAIISYRNQQWIAAGSLAESLTENDPTNPDYLLLSGLVEQAQGNYDQAISYYLSLVQMGGSYSQHAKWYLSLIYLKQGKITECQNHLISIKTQGSNFYKVKAEALLKALDRRL